MNSPHIQNPKNIQDTLSALKSDQKTQSDKRIQTLEMIRWEMKHWFLELHAISSVNVS